jgi:hypothetical protein
MEQGGGWCSQFGLKESGCPQLGEHDARGGRRSPGDAVCGMTGTKLGTHAE